MKTPPCLAVAALSFGFMASVHAALVASFQLEGNANDASALGNNGTLQGDAGFSADTPGGLGGQSLELPVGGAEDSGVSVAPHPSLNGDIFTLSYWVKPTTNQGNAGLERLTSRGGDAFETAIGDRNAVGGAPDLTLSYFQGAWISTETQVALNLWSHVTWRNLGTGPEDMELFVDGVSVFIGPGVPPVPEGSLLNIGTRHNNVEGFEGLIDDVRLYDNALSDEEIAALAVIPEPASTCLLLFGVAWLGMRRKR